MKTSEILERAHALIAEPSARTHRGSFAVDELGGSRHGWEPEACSFCAIGAVQRVMGDRGYLEEGGWRVKQLLHDAARKVSSFETAFDLNDHGTDDELDACFHTAIAMAKELEAV